MGAGEIAVGLRRGKFSGADIKKAKLKGRLSDLSRAGHIQPVLFLALCAILVPFFPRARRLGEPDEPSQSRRRRTHRSAVSHRLHGQRNLRLPRNWAQESPLRLPMPWWLRATISWWRRTSEHLWVRPRESVCSRSPRPEEARGFVELDRWQAVLCHGRKSPCRRTHPHAPGSEFEGSPVKTPSSSRLSAMIPLGGLDHTGTGGIGVLPRAVRIQGFVEDSVEPLDSLRLTGRSTMSPWTDPRPPSSNGEFDFKVQVEGGCYRVDVTVTDAVGQEASDSGDFVLWEESEELQGYLWWTDDDGDGWESPRTRSGLRCAERCRGYVTEDCDDSDADIHPGHADYCSDESTPTVTPSPRRLLPPRRDRLKVAQASLTGGVTSSAVRETSTTTATMTSRRPWWTRRPTHLRSVSAISRVMCNGERADHQPTGPCRRSRNRHARWKRHLDGVPDLLLGNPQWTWACSSKSNSAGGRASSKEAPVSVWRDGNWLTDSSSASRGTLFRCRPTSSPTTATSARRGFGGSAR